MNDADEIKRLLIPVIKRSPFILILVVFSVWITKKAVNKYAVPMYQAMVKIKIDVAGSSSMAESSLFEDFDVLSTKSTVETEVEVIKSNDILRKTCMILPKFEVSWWRKGDIKKTELYNNCPFNIEHTLEEGTKGAKLYYNREFVLDVVDEELFYLHVTSNGKKIKIKGNFGRMISLDHMDMLITFDHLIKRQVKWQDKFIFKINSLDRLVSKAKGSIGVKSVDKDIDVIRITYRSEVPQKTVDFLNALANTYKEDYIESRGSTARRTIEFVDDQIEIIGVRLRKAELELESYKLKNKIVDTRQETMTDLNKISQLKMQLTNLKMQESVLNSLEAGVMEDRELAISFDAFRGNLFSELVKKLQGDKARRRELLVKYKENHQKVRNVDKAINETKDYILDAITNERQSIQIKRRQINRAIDNASGELADLPTKEKQIVILARKFTLLESNYNFLAKKRIEATILEKADIPLQKTIEHPVLPTGAVSPNATLISVLVGFVVALIMIVYIYVKRYIKAVFIAREEIEKYSEVPIIGVVPKVSLSLDQRKIKRQTAAYFKSVVTNLLLHKKLKKGDTITVTSSVKQEGKTFVAKNLAISLSKFGWKVLFVDFDLRKGEVHMAFPGNYHVDLVTAILGEVSDVKDVIYDTDYKRLKYVPNGSLPLTKEIIVDYDQVKTLTSLLKEEFDVVIFNTSPTVMQNDAVFLMQQSDLNLYVARAGVTKYRVLDNPDMLIEEYDLKNVFYIVNGIGGRINYNGYYVTDIVSWQEIKDYALDLYFGFNQKRDWLREKMKRDKKK